MSEEYDDPFAQHDKAPAMSFADQPLKTVHTIDVSEPARAVQQTDYESRQPAFWENRDGTLGKPKMAAVYNGVDKDGKPLSLWAPIPGDLFEKLGKWEKAYREKGAPIGGGNTVDRIHVQLFDRVPGKKVGKKSIYNVKVESIGPKATPAPVDDPWASSEPSTSSSTSAGFADEPPF